MGCGVSKVDDLPLVIRCRERKELIKAAADHRYALAAAHISYFRSLKEVGDALRKFVDEELVFSSHSSSPVLTLPSEEGKTKKRSSNDKKSSSPSISLSHSGSDLHIHSVEDDDKDVDDSHLHTSSDSHLHLSSDSEMGSPESGHIHIHDDTPKEDGPSFSPLPYTDWGPSGVNPPPQTAWAPYGMYPPPQTGWSPYGGNQQFQNWDSYEGNSSSHAYYMKKSAPAVRTVIHSAEPTPGVGQWSATSYGYSNSYSSYPYGNGGFFGFPMSSPPSEPPENRQPSPPAGPPPPPSPKVSAWDFLNPFDVYDNGYAGYYSKNKYGYSSIASSPDSNEVREREGIPELEEETETEVLREVHKGKKLHEDTRKTSGEGTSRAVPVQKSEGSSRTVSSSLSSEGSKATSPSWKSETIPRAVPPQNAEEPGPPIVDVKEEKSSPSPDTLVSKSTEEGYVAKKGVSFEVDDASPLDAESSKLSSLTTLSTHGNRDLKEVVDEIRDEFEIASSYGKEVAVMLESGKLPYQRRFTKVIVSRIMYLIAPSSSSSQFPSRRSVRLAFRTRKLAKSYYGHTGRDMNVKPIDLSSTLEKLYEWEKKLYNEVKDEERLRVIYERQCKRLRVLDDRGAESSKIEATQDSIRKLLTKLNICIKTIDAISSRIHKLRDEELQPQLTALIEGLKRMWRSMLKCHHKQFQAIMESETRNLRANTGFRTDSSLRATRELETELQRWTENFNDWINTQKSYVESLNRWLLNCLHYEPEETPDGTIPFSPARIGAPPVFIICHDWNQATEAISETRVSDTMQKFAIALRQLWERQDEEQRQRLRAEYLKRDFQQRVRTLQNEKGGKDVSIVASENRVSSSKDLNADLASIKEKLAEERARHKEAIKLVHDAASSSLQGGLVPIFRALEGFTSKALKAYDHIRIANSGQGS